MRKVQVVFGQHAESDFTCRRCGGSDAACFFCGGKPIVRYRGYTYAVPEGMPDVKLWGHVWTPSLPFPKIATVIALTSDYDGPIKELIPNQQLSTGPAPVWS